ncbi:MULTISPECIES: envelope stress response membrane protein PspB [Shewanella]|uniref:Envelope stress response membrane protein PspB n=1 Tax=Shewanella litorisediminis TaxID=1173586 RepID=A0ABX7G6K4_9GAMM|nr:MULTISPECIES: envelope stress response membrane protein PspB [Shewanella]MCL2916858.1 envelope stress response membrane protein PspB [Shewanella litorisediminis]QRH02974.1 envelope stress response membrane protein PspB [Shewanella litorisediminis]QYJ76581.1 envelope stress response membrane protein PspB [Shewanella sp. FJAT-52076]QYK06501.1 envelope stress response membrane protein PspB [Shewanella zhangzhouensis]
MDMDVLMAPIIIFMVIVAPIWLVLHYRSKRQVSQGLTDEEFKQLNELIALADKMDQRIETLEAILDAESPEWRNKHEHA